MGPPFPNYYTKIRKEKLIRLPIPNLMVVTKISSFAGHRLIICNKIKKKNMENGLSKKNTSVKTAKFTHNDTE